MALLLTPNIDVLVCGGRDYDKKDELEFVLDFVLDKLQTLLMSGTFLHNENPMDCITIIHGAARGADSLAGEWAESRGLKVKEFPADWDKYGIKAGTIRNKQMLDENDISYTIAFPGGTGTQNMITQALKRKTPRVITYDKGALHELQSGRKLVLGLDGIE